MATHDYVIDNQTAPNFRSDLNNAFQAIVTQNSNATAPSVTYADMIWYDTANNQIKKRNEANSSWITLGTVNEALGTFTPSGVSDAVTHLGTLNTTSGSSVTLSGLTLTSYKMLFASINAVGGTTPASSVVFLYLGAATTGAIVGPIGLSTTAEPTTGFISVDLANGAVGGSTKRSIYSTFADTSGGQSGLSTSSTSVTFSLDIGTFSTGSIRIYGVK